jgi:hypothetical protein
MDQEKITPMLLLDEGNLSYSECCGILLNKKFGMSYRTGEEYYKDRLKLLSLHCKENLSQYISRQLKESCYDSNAKFTADKKNEMRQHIIRRRNIFNAPTLLWDILLNSNVSIKQNLDEKFVEPIEEVRMIDLELGSIWGELEENNFEFYTSQNGKLIIYPSIDYQLLMRALDYYYFGIKLEEDSRTDYTLNPFLWAAHLIVKNDMLPNFKREFSNAFEMHNATESLQKAIQNELGTEKTHAKELVTQLRTLNSALKNQQK